MKEQNAKLLRRTK